MEGRAHTGPGWLATALGVLVLVTSGFVVGLLAGVVSQEPELVMGHVQGHGESVPWSPEPGASPSEAAHDPASTPPGPSADGTPIDVAAETRPAAVAPEPAASNATAVARDLPAVASPGPQPAQPAVESAQRAKEPARPSVEPSSGRYSVQVGAFADSQGADRVAASLGEKGYPVYVTPTSASGDGRWRVRVGPVSGRERAEQVAQRLKQEEQLPTWVLAEGGR